MECKQGNNCPYLNGRSALDLLRERNYLHQRLSEMEKIMAMAQDEIERLQKENRELKEKEEELRYELKRMLSKVFKPKVKSKPSKRGAPLGHRGNSRRRPKEVSYYVKVYPKICNQCGNKVRVYENNFKDHLVEDIEIRRKTVCYRMHYGYCEKCGKVIYPKEETVVSNDRIGPVARAVGSYLRYLGLPYRKVARIFNELFGLKLTHPSLLAFDNEQAKNGAGIYQAIKEKVRDSPVVNVDETGWRVCGENYWLWVFANQNMAFYRIEKSRGSEVVNNTLGEKFQGVVVCDFYSAYNKVKAKQRCLGHLLEEIKKIEEKNRFTKDSEEGLWCEELKATLKEGIRVFNEFKEGKISYKELSVARSAIVDKMVALIMTTSGDKDIKRLMRRIIKHHREIFLFLENPDVEPTNNRAERLLRPSVIMRKITFGNRSSLGAKNHAVITSILQTGILNNIEPLDIFLELSKKSHSLPFKLPPIRGP